MKRRSGLLNRSGRLNRRSGRISQAQTSQPQISQPQSFHPQASESQASQPQSQVNLQPSQEGKTSQHKRTRCPTLSNPQASESQVNPQPSQEGETSQRKRTRGPTLCIDVHEMEPGKRIQVALNKYKQGIGEPAKKITRFLGTFARNGHLLPIDVHDWRKMPDYNKENVWQKVLDKFHIPEEGKDWTMKNLSAKWKGWKHKLNKKYYNDEATQVNCPNDTRVLAEQWGNLVVYWKSNDYKKRSATNIENRCKSKAKHCAGTKSYARIAHEEREKTGVDMDRAELWIKTHTRKDGTPVDDIAASVMSQIREIKSTQLEGTYSSAASKDDILAQVMGEERRDLVRGLGIGPTPSDLWGRTHRSDFTSQLLSEKQKLSERLSQLEDKMSQMMEMFMRRPASNSSPPPASSPHQFNSSIASHVSPFDKGHAATAPPNKATTTRDLLRRGGEDQSHCIPCKLLSVDGSVVAKGYLQSEDPAKIVGGSPLGSGWCEINIRKVLVSSAPLFKSHGCMKIVRDATGRNVAWPRAFIKL